MATLIELVKELRERTNAGFADCKKALEATDCDMDKAIDWLREKGIAKSASKASRVAAEGLSKVIVDGNKAVIVEVNSETDFSAKNDLFKNLVNTVAETILANQPADVNAALAIETENGVLSEVIAQTSFQTGEKMDLRRFEVVEKTDDQIFGTYVHFDGKRACVVVLDGSDETVAKNVAMQIASMAPQYVDQAAIPAEIVEHETEVQKNIMASDESVANKPENIKEKMLTGKVNKALKEICLTSQQFILDNNLTVGQYLKNNKMTAVKFVNYVVGEGIEKKKDDWVAEVAAAAKVD